MSQTTTDSEFNQVKDTFDLLGRVVKREESKPGSAPVVVAEYSYDRAGNVVEQKGAVLADNSLQTTGFAYNLLSQLTSVTNANNETTHYQYNMLGNVTKTIHPDATFSCDDRLSGHGTKEVFG